MEIPDIVVGEFSVLTVLGAAPIVAAPAKEVVVEQLPNTLPYALWGDDNLAPIHMLKNIEKDTVIFQSSQFNIASHYGSGLDYVREIRTKNGIELDYTSIPEIDDFIEANDLNAVFCETVHDYEKIGNRIVSFLPNKKRDLIARVIRKDAAWGRWEIQDKASRKVKQLYYNADWERDFNNKNGDKFPVLDVFDPIGDLTKRIKTGNEFVFRNKVFTSNRYYYELANVEVIMNSGNIEMKDKLKAAYKALIDNSLGIAYHIKVTDEYCKKQIAKADEAKWESDPAFRYDVQKKIKEKIDKFLTGVQSQGKSILSVKYRNGKGELEDGIEIVTLDNSIKADKWLPSMQQYHAESYNAMEVDPSNTGISNKNDGMNSGSEKKNAFFNNKATLDIDRLYTLMPFYFVAKFNKWTEKYPGFKWRVIDNYPLVQSADLKPTTDKPTTDANKK